MKLLLVDNLVMPEEGSLAALDVHPHLGLLAVSAAAREAGHDVSVFDPKRAVRDGAVPFDETLYEQVANHLVRAAPDAVGFTALGCSFLFAANVAAALKRIEPDLPILLGGPHATMLDRPILQRFGQFDVIVRHEADETIAPVLDALAGRSFEHIEGISWRSSRNELRFTPGRPKVVDLDALPIPSYDLYPMEELALPLLRVEAGRGCPFSCEFCSTAGFFQRSFRLKSAARLVRELDRLHERYGCRDFKLDHDMFTANRRKVVAFCEAVRGRGYRWRVSARVDCVDEELLARMADAGCVNLYFGIETGSQRLQAICGKRLDLALVEPMLDCAHKLGMETTASFITGFPQETLEDQTETLDMLGDCLRRPACLGQLHILAPEPGTPLFAQLGETICYDGVSGPYHSGLLAADDEPTIVAEPGIFQTYYHYPTILPRRRVVLAAAAVDLLRRLGPDLLAYTLRFFDGKLSRLVEGLESFTAAQSSGNPPDGDTMVRFIADKLGQRHHLVPLVGYAMSVHGVGTAQAADLAPFDPARHYVVAPETRRLEAMPDCRRLLDRIRDLGEGETLPEEAEESAVTYLILAGTQGPVAYETDAEGAAMLDLFSEPASPAEIAAALRSEDARRQAAMSIFAGMSDMGLIVMAEPGAGGPR